MKTRLTILSLSAIVIMVAMRWFLFHSAPHRSGPLQHEAYVWQRMWTGPVRNAVAQHGTNFSSLCVLKAEVSWKDGKPKVARMALDYATLAKAQRPVGIALRIGPYAGPFEIKAADFGVRGQAKRDPALSSSNPTTNNAKAPSPLRSAGAVQSVTHDADITVFLATLAASLVTEARTNHVNLGELQIDFDCAESKLDGYRIWVEAIQRRVAPLPVTITALPSWLDSRAFKRLAALATNYVLQVHSVERPRDIHAPFTLCDPRAARRAVERAGRIGVTFRVALPTYGYTLAFAATGKFIGLSAEGPRPNWPTNAQLREVRSDPIELSGLVQKWTANRPEAMHGVIWYRLPVATDKFNWGWPTLLEIIDSPVAR